MPISRKAPTLPRDANGAPIPIIRPIDGEFKIATDVASNSTPMGKHIRVVRVCPIDFPIILTITDPANPDDPSLSAGTYMPAGIPETFEIQEGEVVRMIRATVNNANVNIVEMN